MAARPVSKALGRAAWPIVGGLTAYFPIGTLVYWLFYNIYDDPGGAETAFKVWFTMSLLTHVGLTLASSVLLSVLFRADILPVLVIVGVGVALFVIPSLAVLALVNDCLGVSFPWDGGCPH